MSFILSLMNSARALDLLKASSILSNMSASWSAASTSSLVLRVQPEGALVCLRMIEMASWLVIDGLSSFSGDAGFGGTLSYACEFYEFLGPLSII